MLRSLYWAFHNIITPPAYPEELARVLDDCDSVLDLGCGPNSPIQHLPESVKRVGLDTFEEAIHKSKAKGIHDEYYCADVLNSADIVGENSFDAVLASDLIEHLSKSDGHKLIKVMEFIGRKKSVIFTPNGFLEQEPYNDDPFQKHLSGWTPDEMTDRGYNVVGMKGAKCLRKERSKIKYKPVRIVRLISRLTQYFVRSKPELAFSIMCVKQL